MGGAGTRLFAGLNAFWPGLADLVLLNSYTKALARHFGARDVAGRD